MKLEALLLTIYVSIFFIIGIVIQKIFKNKTKLVLITTGLTFAIMFSLIFIDFIPEIYELFEEVNQNYTIILAIVFTLIGIASLKILDLFVPEHHHDHQEKEDDINSHNNHLFHIGLITAVSLIIHNILEGISIYITGLTDLKIGFIMAISVGFHNLPLGIEVAIGLNSKNDNSFSKKIVLMLLVISSFIGAFILFILDKHFNATIELMLLSLTLGMIIYITIFELLPEIKTNINKKELKIGLFLGLILVLILFLI